LASGVDFQNTEIEARISTSRSNFGVFTRPTHKTDVPLALTNDCFWERNDSKIELTAKLRGAPVEGRIWYPMSWEEPTKAAGWKTDLSCHIILRWAHQRLWKILYFAKNRVLGSAPNSKVPLAGQGKSPGTLMLGLK
jgi:hypothetical protein